MPKNKEVGALGVFNPDYPKTYAAQLKAPFQGDLDKRPLQKTGQPLRAE